MSRKMRHFVYKTLAELQRAAEQLGAAHVRFAERADEVRRVLARPVRVGPFTVGNSIAIQPMEGCDGTLDGTPGELTWRRYERFARGGAKLVWFEATAVRQDGRANTRQLWITRHNMADYARLVARIREVHRAHWGTADDLLIPIQLTHSGRYSVPRRIIAYHNPSIARETGTPADYPVIADDDLERLEDDYVSAAGLALAAGFEAIDIKAVHGYLISELLGAKTRDGRYGGPLENRLRFIRNVIGKLRAAFGKRLLIAIRMNAFDGVPFGCDFETPYPYGWGVDPANPLHEDLSEVKQAVVASASGVSNCSTSRWDLPTTIRTSAVPSRSPTRATMSNPNIRCWESTGIFASPASYSACFRIFRSSVRAIAGCRSTPSTPGRTTSRWVTFDFWESGVARWRIRISRATRWKRAS